jgi:hypothetical protein
LSQRLANVIALLAEVGVDDLARHEESARQVAEHVDDIVDAARTGLEWARGPWPEVSHNERGMAVVT